jgi:uncharacterized membrane protein
MNIGIIIGFALMGVAVIYSFVGLLFSLDPAKHGWKVAVLTLAGVATTFISAIIHFQR